MKRQCRRGPLLSFDGIPEVDELSETQKQVLTAVASGEHVFVTGRAGCGKSKVVQALVKCMEAANTQHAVLATTGIAAEQVGGVTLHSYVGLNEDLDMKTCVARAKRYKKAALAHVEVLIIDEVSMLSEETFEKFEAILRAFHPAKLPVLVLVGDFLQLPPVQGKMFLNSDAWQRISPTLVLLTDCFRQNDDQFVRVLDEARTGSLSEDSIAVLQSRVGAHIDADGIEPTTLLSRRVGVDELNRQRLEALESEKKRFVARVYHASRNELMVWIEERELSDSLPEDLTSVPLALRDVNVALPNSKDRWMDAASLVTSSNMAPVLQLAVGAQVVFTANIPLYNIVNGTRGVVTSFDAATALPVVKLMNGSSITVQPYRRTRRVTASRSMPCVVYEQIPLQLAWALTIHKSQGMTLDLAQLDIGRDVFSDGQAYVALSRMRNLHGMSLIRFEPKCVRANAAVVSWYTDKK